MHELVDGADAVFVGVLDDVDRRGGTATYAFAVTGVLRGEVGGTAEVRSSASGASCGLELMETGRSYVVMAADGRAGLCGGTAPASPSYVAQVEEVTGEARAPAGAGPAALEPGRDDGDGPAVATVLAVGGAGLLVVAAVVLVAVTRRVRAPRGSRPSG